MHGNKDFPVYVRLVAVIVLFTEILMWHNTRKNQFMIFTRVSYTKLKMLKTGFGNEYGTFLNCHESKIGQIGL